jgi:hypothetical protein
MTATPSHGRVPRRDRAARWPVALRGAALAVMLVGVLGSVWVARGWQSTVTRQRDERLDRETRYPGLQNISWRQIVRDDQAAGFVAAARAEGVEDFTIRPPGRRPVSLGPRPSARSPTS